MMIRKSKSTDSTVYEVITYSNFHWFQCSCRPPVLILFSTFVISLLIAITLLFFNQIPYIFIPTLILYSENNDGYLKDVLPK